IDFAFSGLVLSLEGPAEETEQAWITNDLEFAFQTYGGEGEFARLGITKQMEADHFGAAESRIVEPVELIWTDLLAFLVGELYGQKYSRPDGKLIDDSLFAIFHDDAGKLERQMAKRLSVVLPDGGKEIAYQAVADLRWCAANRAFNGMTD